MTDLAPQDRASMLWHGLSDCRALDAETTMQTVTHWLDHHGAGCPEVPLWQEGVRNDAQFWAEVAQPFELEAYAVAALLKLEKSPLTSRAAKRLAALAWSQMDPADREKFMAWTQRKAEEDGR